MRARELAVELRDHEPLVTVLLCLATVYEVRGDITRAREVAEERLRLVPDAPSARRLSPNELLACSLLHQGLFARAGSRPSSASPVPRGRTRPLRHLPGHARRQRRRLLPQLGFAGSGTWGKPDQALARARRDPTGGGARSSLQPCDRPRQLALLHQCRHEPEAVLASADATIQARTRARLYRVAQATVLRSWALAAIGRHDEGLELLEQGLVASRATGAHLDDPHYLGMLADAACGAGRTAAGLAAVGDALELAVRQRSTSYHAELLRLRGELLLGRGDAPDEAESALLEAVAVASRRGTRPGASGGDDARPALARRGRAREARVLAPAYEWFEEERRPRTRARRRRPARGARAAVGRRGRRPVGSVEQGASWSRCARPHARPCGTPRAVGSTSPTRSRASARSASCSSPGSSPPRAGLGGAAACAAFSIGSPRSRGCPLSKRGAGSPTVRAGYPTSRLGWTMRAVMDAAGIERAVLLGYSEAGRCRRSSPPHVERVSALVLYGTYARGPRRGPSLELRRRTSASPMPTRSSASGAGRPTCARCARTPTRRWPNGGASGCAAASPGAARDLI